MSEKTSNAVAEMLGVSAATIRHARAKAGLPPRKRSKGYTDAEIKLLMAQLRRQPKTIARSSIQQAQRLPEPHSDPAEAKVNTTLGKLGHIESVIEQLMMNTRIMMLQALVEDHAKTIDALLERVAYLERFTYGEDEDKAPTS